MKKIIAIILFPLSLISTLDAQTYTGDWKVSIDVEGNKLEIIFHIIETQGVLSTTWMFQSKALWQSRWKKRI